MPHTEHKFSLLPGKLRKGHHHVGRITGIEVQRGASLRLEESRVHGCTGSGVLLRDEDTSCTLDRCSLVGNALHGLEVQAGSVLVRDSELTGNRVHDLYVSETNGAASRVLERTLAPKVYDKRSQPAQGQPAAVRPGSSEEQGGSEPAGNQPANRPATSEATGSQPTESE